MAVTLSASAQWALVDNFEIGFTPGNDVNGTSGWTTPTAGRAFADSDPASSGRGTVVRFATGATAALYKSLGVTNTIPDGTTGTLFFEVYLANGGGSNMNGGMTIDAAPTTFGNFSPQFRLNGQEISPRDGGGFVDTGLFVDQGAWFKVWIVANSTTDQMDAYVECVSGGFGQQQVANDFGFRKAAGTAIQNALFLQSSANQTYYLDNVYIDNSGENLSDPTDSDSDGMDDFFEVTYFGDLSRDGTLDFDSDNLTDLEEYQNKTEPDNDDTDGDTLLDGDELAGTSNSFDGTPTDPRDPDSDGDGVDDFEENGSLNGEFANAATDPNDPDTDGDGLSDSFELANNNSGTALDPNDDGSGDPTQAPGGDRDGDTLSNIDELNGVLSGVQTRADLSDTDGDGYDDNVENNTGSWTSVTATGTNPVLVDSDADSIPDGNENPDLTFQGAGVFPNNSDPNLVDSDLDSVTDLVEIEEGNDPSLNTDTPVGAVGFRLIESFESGYIAGQTLDGLNGWSIEKPASVTVDNDPAASGRGLVGVASPDGEYDIENALRGYQIPEGQVGTIYFEAYIPGGSANINLGASSESTPSSYGSYSPQFRITAADLFPRNGGGFTDTGFDARVGQWMKVWLVVDNATDTSDMYVLSPEGELGQVQIADDYGFRVASPTALLTFFAVQAGGQTFYFDNVHIDPNGQNLVDPNDTDLDGMDDAWEMVNFGDLSRDGTLDLDSDNLTDLGEYQNETDPNDPDSDLDTLLDGDEVAGTSNSFDGAPTDPLAADSDGDGVDDFEENGSLNTAFANAPTDPNAADTDGDAIPDDYELANNTPGTALDPNDDGSTDPTQAASADRDGDNTIPANPTSNLDEFLANPQTRADLADTDADGLNDGQEDNFGSWFSIDATGTDPTNPDTDGDGILDGDENFDLASFPGQGVFPTNSDPNLADTDGDSFPDDREVADGSDPNDNSDTPAQPSGFQLVENFEGPGMVIGNTFDGVNGWTANQPGVLVADEPIAGGDQIGSIESFDGSGSYAVFKSLSDLDLQVLGDGVNSTGTLFFQLYCTTDQVNHSVGLSDVDSPTTFSDFETQAVVFNGEIIRARDAAAFDDVGAYAAGEWYNVWIVANNATDEMTLYWETPVGETGQVQLQDGTLDGVFSFRNGTTEALRTLLIVSADGAGNNQPIYIDNIYIDPTAENLTTPAAAKPALGEFKVTSVIRNGLGDLEITFSPGGAGYILTSSPDLQAAFTEEAAATYDNIDTFTVPKAFLDANPDKYFFRVEDTP
ncbi:carbohydrate binding protein, cbp35A [Haloferula helveola]|uniref:Carbohydrate binding protein, cbp35A n=2 Tax=Haloferula helveola TaxID=490095 RepID=A0ABN6H1K8_9BACT|nr:carbohydrate binding protein, cbp35A [Haloferula helveola]